MPKVAAAKGEKRAIDVSVWRSELNAFEEFSVPVRDSQTVLDVVSYIQAHLDPTLSYRFACRVGMCGSCAMMVNGKPRWTCRSHVRNAIVDNRLVIAPLRNLPVVKDLVADMDPFFDKWVAADGVFKPSKTRSDPIEPVDPTSVPRQLADAGVECINCAVCYAACDTVAGNSEYLGPAALNRAWTLVNDEKDAGHERRMAAVTGKGGCQNCHSIGSCAHYCPNELNPMQAIGGLKREIVKGWLR